MCLTIPKKVIKISDEEITVETLSGKRQTVKSIIEVKLGDTVITQQNVIIEKISQEEYDKMIELISV